MTPFLVAARTSAAGTEALRTSRVVGYAPEDIASRLAASYVILPSKIRLVEDESDDDAVKEEGRRAGAVRRRA